jgi:hypothetical protein
VEVIYAGDPWRYGCQKSCVILLSCYCGHAHPRAGTQIPSKYVCW